MFDPNGFKVNGNGDLEITMYNKNQEISGIALVDAKHYDLVTKHKWAMSCGYSVCKVNGKNVYLHRLICDDPVDMVVDHINHDTLDNRDINLRICSHQENLRNHSGNSRNTSGVKGVSLDRKTNKWKAQIRHNNKTIVIGSLLNINDAIDARKELEVKYYGEFRYAKK